MYSKAQFFGDFVKTYGYLGPANFRFGQLAVPTPGSTHDELHAGLAFHVRDVFGDPGLTDSQLASGRRERATPCERRERPQARLELHNRGLCLGRLL
jgi:hypothetical protein